MALSLNEAPLPADIEAIVAQRIKEAVDARLAEAMEVLSAKAAERPASDQSGFLGLAEGLAMAIAELNDQGSGRKRLAPDVVKKRRAAHERMTELIEEARATGARPMYAVMDIVVLDEQLIQPMWRTGQEVRRTKIEWCEAPNGMMRPINDVAAAIYEAFQESIGGIGPTPTANQRISQRGVVYVDGRSAAPLPNVAEPVQSASGLKVLDRGGVGDRVETHILGTWAKPAVETRLMGGDVA